jgi:hypothetical protein
MLGSLQLYDVTVSFKLVPFRVYATDPVPLSLLEASLEFPFHDAVQHSLIV